MEKLKQRVTSWKRAFTQNLTNVDENSTWKDILLALDLTAIKNINLLKQTVQKCQTFTEEERETLKHLPHFNEIMDLMEEMPNSVITDIHSIQFANGDAVYLLCYPLKKDESTVDGMIIDATIVPENSVDCDFDIYISLINFLEIKNVIISYKPEIPKEWLEHEADRQKK